MAELASAALRNTAQQYVKLFKMAPAIVRAISGLAKPDEKAAEKLTTTAPKKFNLFAPRTSLNVSITNQRTFAGCGVASFPAQANNPTCTHPGCGIAQSQIYQLRVIRNPIIFLCPFITFTSNVAVVTNKTQDVGACVIFYS